MTSRTFFNLLHPRFPPYLALTMVIGLCLPACKRHPEARATHQPAGPTIAKPDIEPEIIKPEEATPAKFAGIDEARIEKGYATAVFANGRRKMFPFSGLDEKERDWLTAFAEKHPLAHSKSIVTEVHEPAKKTVVRQTKDGSVEVVQLCPPAILRDQIGGTCALYATVHYLDIAGYPVDNASIYKVIDKSPPENPWLDPQYRTRLERLLTDMVPTPTLHFAQNADRPFDWAREQLRLGRPVMALLPEDIWRALPASFLATHPWDGAKVGHAVVINGFTFDATNPSKATFHVINSWRDLSEFDVPADAAAKSVVVIQQSISPKGEVEVPTEPLVVKQITQLNPIGKQFLFLVQTNLGERKVVAADEAAARQLIEERNRPALKPGTEPVLNDSEQIGNLLIQAHDEIKRTVARDAQDAVFADIVWQITHQPKTGHLPRVEANVKRATGGIFFVRVSADLVLEITAQNAAEALDLSGQRRDI